PCLEHVPELVRCPLAEREVNAVRMVDVEPQGLRGGALERDQLDLGVEVVQLALDLVLKLVQNWSFWSSFRPPPPHSEPKKRRARAHLIRVRVRKEVIVSIASRRAVQAWARREPRPPGRVPDAPLQAAQASTITVTGPSFTSSTAIRAPNLPRLAPRRSQKRSKRGSASSAGAAAAKLGRAPFSVSAYSVNWLTQSASRSPRASL